MSAHAPALAALGVPESARPGLAAYLDLLAAWSQRVNLTGARTPEQRVQVLVADPLRAAALPEPGLLLDVGSGNGSPGLVLGLLRPELSVVLLEPRARRWAFLREAARVAGRPEIQVLRQRHDAYAGRPAQTLTLRGLALPLGQLAALVAPSGLVLAFGGAPAPQPPFAREAQYELGSGWLHVFRRVPPGCST